MEQAQVVIIRDNRGSPKEVFRERLSTSTISLLTLAPSTSVMSILMLHSSWKDNLSVPTE